MKFPMDEAHGNTLLGYLRGTLQVNAMLVTGIRGNAIHIDGQSRVDFVVPASNCFVDPNQCDQGITFSFWLMLLQKTIRTYAIFSNDVAQPFHVAGYYFWLFPGDKVALFVNTGNTIYRNTYAFPQPLTSEWGFVVFTYYNGDLKMFYDGCQLEPFSTNTHESSATVNKTFYIGNLVDMLRSKVVIDELQVWYKVFTADEIWDLYVQGGDVDLQTG